MYLMWLGALIWFVALAYSTVFLNYLITGLVFLLGLSYLLISISMFNYVQIAIFSLDLKLKYKKG